MKKHIIFGSIILGLGVGLYCLDRWIGKEIGKAATWPPSPPSEDSELMKIPHEAFYQIGIYTPHDIEHAQDYAKAICSHKNTYTDSVDSIDGFNRSAKGFLTGLILHIAYRNNTREVSLKDIEDNVSVLILDPSLLHQMTLASHNRAAGWEAKERAGFFWTHDIVRMAAQDMIERPVQERTAILVHINHMLQARK